MKELKEDNNLVNFCFEGENAIDYETLFESQNHFLEAYREIQRKYFPTKDFEINVGAFNKAGFDVGYLVGFAPAVHLLSSASDQSSLEILQKALATLISIITIHKAINGEKPVAETKVNDETTALNLGNNKIINVNNFYLHVYKDHTAVTNHITKAFEVIADNEKITGVKIHRRGKEILLTLKKADLAALSAHNPYVNKEQKESVSKARVFVKKANFYKDGNKPWQWEFIFNGTSIKAIITDKSFENAVNKGKTFHRGTKLVVDLKKVSKWEPKFRAYLIKSYEITKVHEIEDFSSSLGQTDLFDI